LPAPHAAPTGSQAAKRVRLALRADDERVCARSHCLPPPVHSLAAQDALRDFLHGRALADAARGPTFRPPAALAVSPGTVLSGYQVRRPAAAPAPLTVFAQLQVAQQAVLADTLVVLAPALPWQPIATALVLTVLGAGGSVRASTVVPSCC
jgi:hypothetical protein